MLVCTRYNPLTQLKKELQSVYKRSNPEKHSKLVSICGQAKYKSTTNNSEDSNDMSGDLKLAVALLKEVQPILRQGRFYQFWSDGGCRKVMRTARQMGIFMRDIKHSVPAQGSRTTPCKKSNITPQ